MTSLSLRRANRLAGASTIVLAALFSLESTAYAQAPTAQVEEIVVTGSRTVRDGSRTPTPITVVSAEDLQSLSARNIVEGLQALPSLAGTSSTNTTRATAAQNYVGSFLNLRGLGAGRTLTLLDGRRLSPSGTDGAADFNVIPQDLIERIDIITGGASAAYGSDAVAGVVNVILDTDFTGVKGVIQGGISDRGDVGNYRFSLSGGNRYMDDRLHVLASYTNNRSNALDSFLDRDWVRAPSHYGDGRLTSTVPVSQTPNVDGQGILRAMYPGGVIPWASQSAAVRTAFGLSLLTESPAGSGQTVGGQYYKFLPDGSGGVVGSPYNVGTLNSSSFQIGGDGVYTVASIAALLEQQTLFGRATYDVTDNFQVFAEISAADIHNRWYLADNQVQLNTHTAAGTAYTIFQGNPYLPADAAARLASTPLVAAGSGCNNGPTPSRCFRMTSPIIPRIQGDIESKYLNFTTGFSATIFGDYRLSGYWQQGKNDNDLITVNNQWYERLYAAADAVIDPATNRPTCNILLTGTAEQKARFAGCVPSNLFGFGSLSPEATAWLETDPKTTWILKQEVFALDFAGEPFQLPAGPLGFALGVEHRTVSADLIGNPEAEGEITGSGIRGFPISLVGRTGVYRNTNQPSYAGSVSVNEAYTELNLPLLEGMTLAEELSLNAAFRYTDYSLSGPVNTWKVGLSYKPVESLRFRGTISRDIRQPAPSELFQGSAGGGETIDDLLVPANGQYAARVVRGGNPDLVPEKADTYTVGIVFQPTFLPGFTASVDYYDISIEDAIQSSRGQIVILTCFQGVQSSCAKINRDANGFIQTIDAPFLNLATFNVNGTDFELSYRRSFDSIPGRFSVRSLVSYLGKKEIAAPGAPTIDYAGESARSPSPRLRALTTFGYENGPVGLSVQHRYIGKGKADILLREGIDIDNNTIKANTVYDLNASYKFGRDLEQEAFLTINNVLDQAPPPGSSELFGGVTRKDLYEAIGRSYVTGLRFRF